MTNIDKARTLRSRSTEAEKLIWRFIRNRICLGLKFRRQHPVEAYIVDFACIEIGLAIELDGGQHAASTQYDEARSKVIKAAGFEIVRFWNNDVLTNTEGVLERLRTICLSRMEGVGPSPLPSPKRRGG